MMNAKRLFHYKYTAWHKIIIIIIIIIINIINIIIIIIIAIQRFNGVIFKFFLPHWWQHRNPSEAHL